MNATATPSMNAPYAAMPGPMTATPLGTKLLWGSVAVLGAAVVAMGATLVNLQSQNQAINVQRAQAKAQTPGELLATAPPAAGLTSRSVGTEASLAPGETVATDKPATPTIVIHNHMPPATTAPARQVQQAQRSVAPVQQAQVARPAPVAPVAPQFQVAQAPQGAPVYVPAAVPVAVTAPAPAQPQVVTHAPYPHAPVVYSGYPPVVHGQAPVQTAGYPQVVQHPSSTLGTVESVTPVQRNAKSDGLGAVAGGVLGAIVGNQIGKGGGRTLGTIVGAVGGGIAGNAIERRMKKETVYQVGVRMDDGSLRTIEQASAPSIGSRINLSQANQAANTLPARPATRAIEAYPGADRA